MLAPYFFHKTRVQKSDKEICTLFFFVCAAQDSLGGAIVSLECRVLPLKTFDALRAVYRLLFRLIKSGAFAMAVWVAVS